ncbi:MAG: TonB-dependent receptor [Cellvibrionaceae bacterium]|nr:TonB-dependent receptor [Cellvibrionaceae bacterium]
MNQYRHCPLALAVALSLSVNTAAQAVIEEVSVVASPIRDSQRAAIEAKREADNYVDVLSADTVGRFPDQNVAETLARVPGLAVERDQGQARFVNFRGAPARYTALSFNDIQIPGAENGRTPRFDSFPSVITSTIEANKAVTPRMPAEAISGAINIDTFDPFSREGLALSADLGIGEQRLGKGDVDTRNLRLSWSGEQWGAMVFYSNNQRNQITDNREYDLAIDPASNELLVNELDFRSYQVEREDEAYGGHLEYRFADGYSRAFVSSLFSEFSDREYRNQFIFDFTAAGPAQPGTSNYVPVAAVSRYLSDGLYQNSTLSNTLGLDLDLAEWLLQLRINSAETENITDLPLLMDNAGLVAAQYDVSDIEDPALSLYAMASTNPIDLADVQYNGRYQYAVPVLFDLQNDSLKVKLDASREFNQHKLELGLLYDQRESSSSNLVGFLPLATVGGLDLAPFNSGRPWDTDFSNGIGGTYYDNPAAKAAYQAAVDVSAFTPDISDIEEDISAAYAMATSDFEWGNVVYGVRLEHTDFSVTSAAVSDGRSYTNVLPSVHVNYDLTDSQKLRLSLNTGISRPSYSELHAAPRVIVVQRSVVAGNPSLDEEKSKGLDASWEWYIGDTSLFAVGAFYRDIDNVIYLASRRLSDTDPDYGQYAGFELTETFNGKDGELRGLEVNLIAYASDLFNGALEGFGFTANTSVVRSEFTTQQAVKFDLPGTSELTYNASVFYEGGGFSARLNYQYRDDYLSGVAESGSDASVWAEQERLDLSLRYSLPGEWVGDWDVSVYLNANNLMDAVDIRYEGSIRTPDQVERYGRRYLAGVRVSF